VSPDAETPKTLVVADSTYALQLIGFYSLDALLKFANRNELPERLYYRKETLQGRPWFALIHSLHEDYSSASAQLHNLPPELVTMDPWIRPIRAGVELSVLDTGSQRRP
jgi:DamX protein